MRKAAHETEESGRFRPGQMSCGFYKAFARMVWNLMGSLFESANQANQKNYITGQQMMLPWI